MGRTRPLAGGRPTAPRGAVPRTAAAITTRLTAGERRGRIRPGARPARPTGPLGVPAMPPDARRLSALKNIGTTAETWLNDAGIASPDDLARVGPVGAWRRVKVAHPTSVTVLLLYALRGALLDLHWNDVPPDLKAQLRETAGLPEGRRRDLSP